VYGENVERLLVFMVAQLSRDNVTAAEEEDAEHNEWWQEVHESDLVVVSKECNDQSCNRKEQVSFERDFDQVLKSLSKGIGEVDVKFEVMESLLTVRVHPLNRTVSQLYISERFVEGWIALHTMRHDVMEVLILEPVGL